MLTIRHSGKRRPQQAVRIAKMIVSHPELFDVLVEVYRFCSNSLEDVELALDGTIDPSLTTAFIADLKAYFGNSSGGDYGNLRGDLFEELIALLDAKTLGLCGGFTTSTIRDCDFLENGQRISKHAHNIDVAFETTVSIQAVECKVGLKNWLLQKNIITDRSQAKLDYIEEIAEYCQSHCYRLRFSFCCMDSERDFVQANAFLSCRYSYIKLIDRVALAQLFDARKGA